MTPYRLAVGFAVVAGALLVATLPSSGATGVRHGGLGLGARGLEESRSTQRLQPGVTLSTIVRGRRDTDARWTVEVAIPAGAGSPDPDAPPAAISDRASAQDSAARLRNAGFAPRVEHVSTARVADYGGSLGYRVRVGRYAGRAVADAAGDRIRQRTGLTGSSVYTGWDPDPASTGPWRIRVVRIDPRSFDGSLVGSYGPDLERRETTSDLALRRAATAAVNAGFFVLDPAAGAPGDPAGVGVYAGRVESEAVGDRPALVFDRDGDDGGVVRLRWRGTATSRRGSLPLDGVNRVPGLVRNCGGTADDEPTADPLHDFTCTDADEAVLFTPAYGEQTPQGAGAEAVLDARGVVVHMRSARGGVVPPGGSTLQATGAEADELRALAPVGTRLRVSSVLTGPDGRPVPRSRSAYVLNGGPELVDDGHLQATPRRDGMVHPGDPSFYYGWAHKRNPRSLAGIDAAGRIVLVTVDGRSLRSLGLSVAESARLARDLGLRDAVGLDGGGSTTMVVRGRVVNHPSDTTGERPVGDAVLVLPR